MRSGLEGPFTLLGRIWREANEAAAGRQPVAELGYLCVEFYPWGIEVFKGEAALHAPAERP